MKRVMTILLLLVPATLTAQDSLRLSLEEAIYLACVRSVDAVSARSLFKSSYWQFRTYKAELLPEIGLTATAPYYSKSFDPYQNPDGSYDFVRNDYSRVDAGLSLSQIIPWTGGTLAVESSFQRLAQNGKKSSSYSTVPFTFTLSQPLSGFNPYKWLRKTEPLRYQASRLQLTADMEYVAYNTVNYYFELLLEQVNGEIARQNYQNAVKMHEIGQARRQTGQISENELLQLRLSMLNAEQYLTEAASALRGKMFQLRSYIGLDQNTVVVPSLPGDFPVGVVLDYERVAEYSLRNNPFTSDNRVMLLEAEREVSRARSEMTDISFYASFGRAGYGDTFRGAYRPSNRTENRIFEVGITFPIVDWGRRKGKVKIARANLEVAESRARKDELDFRQDIFLYVEDFNNQTRQINIARETDEIAGRRYESSLEAFLLGKIDLLNFNDARSAKDEARRNYLLQTAALWSCHYRIRALSLYDFVADREITIDHDAVLNNKWTGAAPLPDGYEAAEDFMSIFMQKFLPR